MSKSYPILAAACAAALVQSAAFATVTINGSYDSDYGAPFALQTNNTGFGNNSNTDGNTANGNELDGAYAVVQNGYLNLLFTGNVATDFTHLNIFIADGRAGQTTLNASTAGGGGGNALSNMNGSKFSPGFAGTYALDINGGQPNGNPPLTWFANRWDLTQTTAPGSFIGSFNPTKGSQSEFINGAVHSGILASFDNSNVDGVNGDTGTTTLGADPAAVQTGFELAIPLTQLGSPTGSIKVLVDINGGGNGFLSNQFLPGLPSGSGNLGGNAGKSSFDFSGTPNMYFTVNVPAGGNVNAVWASSATGSWGTAGNWQGSNPPLAAGDSALFGSAIGGPITVALDGNRTLGRIIFDNVNSYSIIPGSGGSITLDDTGDASGVNPTIASLSGVHFITAPIALANGATISTAAGSGVSILGNISGNGPIVKDGAGRAFLLGNNTYSGGTQVLAGSLELDSNNAASTGEISIGDVTADGVAAALEIGITGMNLASTITTNVEPTTTSDMRIIAGRYTSGSATLSGTINVNGGVVLSASDGATLNVTGAIQDGADTSSSVRHSLHIAGAGTVVISNNVNLTSTGSFDNGDTFVDSGTLVLASGASLSSGSLNVISGAAFINGALADGVKLYTNGNLNFPGNASLNTATLNTSTISVDSAGIMKVGVSTSSAHPLVINANGAVEFLNDFTGKIDLTNNQLSAAISPSTARDQLFAGNIITSIAGGTLGYKDNGSGGTLIQFAVGGDATLDNIANSDDFSLLANNFNQTGKFWADGDFNYDGTVNALDFNILASHYGQTLASTALGSLVPEPVLIVPGLIGLVVMRRRRRLV
jgi:autotransporter-associated beta strand protein